jgi:hypothetical protein
VVDLSPAPGGEESNYAAKVANASDRDIPRVPCRIESGGCNHPHPRSPVRESPKVRVISGLERLHSQPKSER